MSIENNVSYPKGIKHVHVDPAKVERRKAFLR